MKVMLIPLAMAADASNTRIPIKYTEIGTTGAERLGDRPLVSEIVSLSSQRKPKLSTRRRHRHDT